jgi:hypothetical protein
MRYSLLDHRRNEDILELNMDLTKKKLAQHKQDKDQTLKTIS